MKPMLKFNRLLPIVVAVGALLLGVKGQGLVRAALAQGASSVESILAQDTAPLGTDIADASSDDSAGKNEVAVGFAKRRETLDARESELGERAQLIAATEKRVDGKIATLKQLQDQIAQMLGQRDDEQKKQITSLVKTYSAMKSKDAARIFDTLPDDVLIPVAAAMKSDVLAPIMAGMNSDAAKKLTVSLANRLKLPEVVSPAQPASELAAICTPQADGTPAQTPTPPQPSKGKRS
jgi:flagellar motility protein MotE (MotC chaperone)